MTLHRLRIVTAGAFNLFVALSLCTPSWRYGPFSWWPLWKFDELAGGPVGFGILNGLPLLIGVGMLAARRKGEQWRWGRPVVTLPLAALTAWGMLRMDWATLRLAFIYVGAFALAWLVYLYVINERPPLAPALAAVLLVQGAVAIGQFALQRDLGLVFMGELPLNPVFAGVTVLVARGQPWLRAYGLTAHPNLLGAMMAVLLLLLLPRITRAQRWRRAALLVAAAVGLAALLLSFSRAAWLAFGLGLLIWLWLRRRPMNLSEWSLRRALKVILPLALLLVFLVAYQDLILSRFIDLDSPVEARSIQQRLEDAQRALRLFAERPVLGAGLGHFVDAASRYDEDAARVHNVPLLVAAEMGAVGLLLVLVLFLAPLIAPFVARRRGYGRDAHTTRLNWAVRLTPWLAMVVVNQLDTTLWITGNWQTAILFGLIAARAAQPVQFSSDGRRPTTGDEKTR